MDSRSSMILLVLLLAVSCASMTEARPSRIPGSFHRHRLTNLKRIPSRIRRAASYSGLDLLTIPGLYRGSYLSAYTPCNSSVERFAISVVVVYSIGIADFNIGFFSFFQSSLNDSSYPGHFAVFNKSQDLSSDSPQYNISFLPWKNESDSINFASAAGGGIASYFGVAAQVDRFLPAQSFYYSTYKLFAYASNTYAGAGYSLADLIRGLLRNRKDYTPTIYMEDPPVLTMCGSFFKWYELIH